MDISGKLYIWVTEIKPYEDKNYILDGRPFDDEYGFGLEDLRNYSGDILFVSSKEYTKSKVEIGLAHISRKGKLWTLKTDYLPITPFLMTSNTFSNSEIQRSSGRCTTKVGFTKCWKTHGIYFGQ